MVQKVHYQPITRNEPVLTTTIPKPVFSMYTAFMKAKRLPDAFTFRHAPRSKVTTATPYQGQTTTQSAASATAVTSWTNTK